MKQKLIALGALCAVLCQTAPSWAGGFNLVFSDEFAGNALDRNKWATRYIYADGTQDHLNDEQELFGDFGNHPVAGGALSLVANAKGGGKYDSGMIRSRQTFYYGYFEARVFLPNARGVWPAFWLNSDYDADGRLTWPPEIDAFEYVINDVTEHPNMIHSSVVIGNQPARGGDWLYRDPHFNQQWTFYQAAAPLDADWQVIGMLWKPDSVSLYLNGEKLYTRAYQWVYDDDSKAGPAHVLLDLAIGGGWAGVNGVDDSKFPQSLKVDYVHVCQYTATGTDQRCAGSQYSPSAADAAYTTSDGDLPRSRLLSAQISNATLAPGGTVTVNYAFNAVRTPSNHQLRTTLVAQNGASIAEVAASPPVPTSSWSGTQRMSQSLVIPKTVTPGTYDLLVSVGSYPASGERRISLAANDSFGGADGKLRHKIGQVHVLAK